MANYPVPYQNNWGYGSGAVGAQMYPQYQSYAVQPQQSMAPAQGASQCTHGLIWVDGEVGAKAYQLPAGMPANQPIALWDTNDTVIYLKSINPMGMPNPLQKAHYKLENYTSASPVRETAPASGDRPDMSEYVRKDDMDRMKQELMEAIGNVGVSGTGSNGTVPVRKTSAKGE